MEDRIESVTATEMSNCPSVPAGPPRPGFK